MARSITDLVLCALAAILSAMVWGWVIDAPVLFILRYTGLGFGGLWLAYQIEKVWFSAKNN